MSRVQLTGVRAVVFDLDDTLMSERSFVFSGFAAVAEWLKTRIACPFDSYRRMVDLFETEDRRHIFDRLLAQAGCPDPSQFVPAMVDCYRSHSPAVSLLEDAKRAIQRWQGSFFLGLISDGPYTMQRNKVEALNLPAVLDHIVLTDQWGRQYWKPHVRAFEEVQERSGRREQACLYIADNVMKDFVAPVKLGWRTVQVRRSDGIYERGIGPPEGQPEFVVGSLDEVDLTS